MLEAIAKYFGFKELGTDFKTEILAGITTFLASMYIIIVNPTILAAGGLPFQAVLTATILLSTVGCLLMGIYAKNPVLVAPGMGLNAYFTYTVVLGMKVPWQQALGAVFWAGAAFLVLSIWNIRTSIVRAIPKSIRHGVAAGIGLFIAFIGLKNAGFIVAHPVTLVSQAGVNPVTLTFVFGLFVTALLLVKEVQGAFILGIVLTTLLSIPVGRLWGDASAINHGTKTLMNFNGSFFAWPDFGLLFQADLRGSFKWSFLPIIFSIAFTDLFDSISTFLGMAEAGELLDEHGEPQNIKSSLIVDSLATLIAGPLGTSAGTAYIESAAGIKAGGRSGMVAVVAGLLFLPFLFLSPLISVVPALSTSPVLVLVGVFMLKILVKIDWHHMEEAIPAFLAFLLIPLTFSITQGIIWAFLSWTFLKFMLGKWREISPALWGINALCILSLILS